MVPFAERGSRSPDISVFMCLMSECGSNMDTGEKFFCNVLLTEFKWPLGSCLQYVSDKGNDTVTIRDKTLGNVFNHPALKLLFQLERTFAWIFPVGKTKRVSFIWQFVLCLCLFSLSGFVLQHRGDSGRSQRLPVHGGRAAPARASRAPWNRPLLLTLRKFCTTMITQRCNMWEYPTYWSHAPISKGEAYRYC